MNKYLKDTSRKEAVRYAKHLIHDGYVGEVTGTTWPEMRERFEILIEHGAEFMYSLLEKEIEERQLALNNAASIIQEKISEIIHLKKLIRYAWDQAIVNCEAENGVGLEPYVPWSKFAARNQL